MIRLKGKSERGTKDSSRLIYICCKKLPCAAGNLPWETKELGGGSERGQGEVKKVDVEVFAACHCAKSIEHSEFPLTAWGFKVSQGS